jgi:hypothetical protein
MLVGAILTMLGLLGLQSSLFAGIQIAAIGASPGLSGLVSTRWAADR